MTDHFTTTLSELRRSGDEPRRFSSSFVEVLPVAGASVSTLGSLLGSETISATDAVAARLDEYQFDLAEGPCWDAFRTRSFVAEPDLPRTGATRWPSFSAAVAADDVASIFALPLSVGTLRLGAIDLYSRAPLVLDEGQVRRAVALADVVGRHVLRDALGQIDTDEAYEKTRPYSRRVIHQATGVVLAQLDLDPDEAVLMIRAHAFAVGRSMSDVARDIVDGEVRFVRENGRIEVAT